MPLLELPHTSGCLVCGRDNPQGMHLHLFVDQATGAVQTKLTPSLQQIGFEGIIHGGILATVFDEAMVWAASWHVRRFCVCGELTVRFRKPAQPGKLVHVRANLSASRGRMLQTTAQMSDKSGEILATAEGKYLTLPPDRHQAFLTTFLDEPATAAAAAILRSPAVS